MRFNHAGEVLPDSQLNIVDLVRMAGVISREKGWHDSGQPGMTVGEQLSLLHCEVSEATEEARRGRMSLYFTEVETEDGVPERKPQGFPIELADVVIKACELADRFDQDLVTALREKLAYNSRRPHRHGGKFF
jgi:hypothetical protein